jgi:hypothetical protein
MNTQRLIIGFVLTLLGLAGVITFGVWRYDKYRHTAPPLKAALVRDRSDSTLSGCSELAAMGNELLVSLPFGEGSTIAVMVTGDDSTASEPVLLDVLEVPITKRVTEGRSIIAQKQQALLGRIKERCKEAGETKQSPIYLAIRRAVEYLRAQGCDGRTKCKVFVQSDLEELSEKSIKQLLTEPTRRDQKTQTPLLPTPIDNVGIDLMICGLSETAGDSPIEGKKRTLTPKHDAQRADRIRAVWEKLFTDAKRVGFNSFCPKETG